MMERGEVIGFGPPSVLLEENQSFASLIKKAGFKDDAKKGQWKSESAAAPAPAPAPAEKESLL